LEEMSGDVARDETGRHPARFEDGIAFWLPGVDARRGHQPPRPPADNTFAAGVINRAAHFAGGRLRTELALGGSYTVELWVWNGLPAEARHVTGYILSRGAESESKSRGEYLGIGGTQQTNQNGRLIFGQGNEHDSVLIGRTVLALRAWHHVVLVRDGEDVRIHLDGRSEPEITARKALINSTELKIVFLGGRSDGQFNFEGKLDEIAVYPRALSIGEISAHYRAAQLTR